MTAETLERIEVSSCPTCGGLAQCLAGEPPTWRTAHNANGQPEWHCDVHPTEPGIYYVESCDIHGNPLPGLMFLEQGKQCEPPSIPTKFFGPIPNGMQTRPMVLDGRKQDE